MTLAVVLYIWNVKTVPSCCLFIRTNIIGFVYLMSVIPKQIKQNIYNYFVSCDGKNQTPVQMAGIAIWTGVFSDV